MDALRMRTNGVVFEGGHLCSPWVPAEVNMREIDGRFFYAIRRRDSQFAKASGLQFPTTWGSTPVFAYIKSLRGQAIDDAVGDIEQEDNATDALDTPKERRPRYARCTAVPSVLNIDIPRIECESNVVPAYVMKVASIPNYGFVLEFEFTAAHAECHYNACAASPPSYYNFTQPARKDRR